ncbi:MAG: HAD-IIIC family phosphatase [Prevotellaceae bacterium]|jgi:FkbH-like protein|nr:HAD-IIIC family phosphatase [Prevotellaceae bacterium]
MKYFIFRNYTVEPFFKGLNVVFSGYENISFVDAEAGAYIWFYLSPYRTDNQIIANEITNYGNLLELVLAKINPNKPLLVFTMQVVYKINYQTAESNVEEAIINYNQKIREWTRDNRNLKIIDISDFFNRFSREQLIDWKYYYMSQMPLNPKLASDFQQWFERQLEIIKLQRKKCIVLDLDNTLWGGILGEDGIEGIKMGETYPGNTYRFFQEYCLQLHQNGIILTVCSKNNEQDVLEVWEKHPDMLLRKEHLVTYRINWNNKADNIREIAQELNIGQDSLVFIDDSPTERELVKQMLPQVSVPDFPKQPYLFPEFIKYLTDNYFSAYELTQEDAAKTQQYKENAERRQFQNQFVDFESYLQSLEIELTIEPLNDLNIARLAQMTQKTNQFNLTTKRYTEIDIRNFADKGALIYGLRVKDRFGDNGLTGLIIITTSTKKEAEIDTLLLSCRILGKNIETVFVQYILNKLKVSGVQTVKADYVKTLKNNQVAEFYSYLGFDVENISEMQKRYNINLDNINFSTPQIYKLIEK